ncbi:DUF4197 domain-containing protein [Pelagibius litoralis]|uniref:DUF4197 domain-containing protein n=1 Tax=Pelagibius litoralis TaxID=374515 RepID=A0A967EW36_9PROT|nr:DUF4197 domain-containing protein [Pelagibius litoralis]
MAFFALSLGASFSPDPALAQGSLFDKAKDLLKSGDGETAGGLSSTSLSSAEIGDGLREALKVGTERVVGLLGQTDGFNADPDIHIPLPDSLQKVQKALQTVGMSDLADDLELRLNRAAEEATPQAKQIFWDAISEMSVEDAEGILNGPEDAATRYFQDKMTPPLSDAMRPVVDNSLAEVGAIAAYDNMMGEYRALPLVPDAKADLTDYALEQALDGLFTYVAREEAAIRSDPAKRTTEILQKVFGE